MRPLNRHQPLMSAANYKTYSILSPLATHFRPGTCEEADCRAYARGWVSPIDERTEQGQRWAYRIRKVEGRKYTEHKDAGGMTVFTFEAGQRCFITHQIPLQRPELFVVRDGDWRWRGGQRTHTRPEHWVNDFREHHDQLKTVQERG